jgi:hypothetical protein
VILDKPLESITADDLYALKDNEVPEGKTIEYKRYLPGNLYEDKKGFLSDVSSFANASGGHIIYGILEEEGVPTEIFGLENINPDAEILRLENLLRDCIQPRIPGLSMQPVPLTDSTQAIVIWIPKSWAQPHVVAYQRHWRFYSRNSAGKYPLDVPELRAAFLLSETAAEAIRSFRLERLGRIVAGETPIQLPNSAKIVLHIVPVATTGVPVFLNVGEIYGHYQALAPINYEGLRYRFNFDGFLTYSPPSLGNQASAYVQVFRNGCIEAVEASLLDNRDQQGSAYIHGYRLESYVLQALSRYLSVQRALGLAPPVVIMLSLMGLSGHYLVTRQSSRDERMYPIDRKDLLLPEILVEDLDSEPTRLMQPVFDAVWNAAGWARCKDYSDDGRWIYPTS